MIESALTAIAELFNAAVAARTRFRRVAGFIMPTGMSTNAGATRFPTSPCSAFDRTDTGTITRSTRPRVGSPRASNRSCSPPPTAASTTSLMVPLSARLTPCTSSNGASAVANRRLGPTRTSNGPCGGFPMPTMERRPSSV